MNYVVLRTQTVWCYSKARNNSQLFCLNTKIKLQCLVQEIVAAQLRRSSPHRRRRGGKHIGPWERCVHLAGRDTSGEIPGVPCGGRDTNSASLVACPLAEPALTTNKVVLHWCLCGDVECHLTVLAHSKRVWKLLTQILVAGRDAKIFGVPLCKQVV